MKIVTSDQMRALEKGAAERGITQAALMERAGRAVAQEIRSRLPGIAGRPILVLVGPGNNGGDGLVAAHYLHQWGAEISLYLMAPRGGDDPNYRRILEDRVAVFLASDDPSGATLGSLLASAQVVLDAVLGTGGSRPLEGALRNALRQVNAVRENRRGLLVVAVDLPTGLNADTGGLDPSALHADLTITLGYPKRGHFAFPGAEAVGDLVVADIGLPKELAEDIALELITPEAVAAALPQRPRHGNKGTFGRVLVIGGSANYIGAPALACHAAARVGAGLVSLAAPQSIMPVLEAKLTETTFVPLPEEEMGYISSAAVDELGPWLPRYDVVLIGPGLGQHPSTKEFLKKILLSEALEPSVALVIDADALNMLAETPGWHRGIRNHAILTPHPGEMARLLGGSVPQVQGRRLESALEAAEAWGQTVVLKGAFTVIAAPDGRMNLCGIANSALATAGTGDVLAGAIAGLLAQGMSPFGAAVCGVYLHGAAGELVGKELGDAGPVAGDLLRALPLVIKSLRN